MKKGIRKLIVLLLVLTVTMAYSGIAAFAYTALDDDGDRSKADETTMHVLYSNMGMLRTLDEGTSVTLSEDGTTATVHAVSKPSTSWGSMTKLALIEQTATDEEKDAAASDVVFTNAEFTEESVSREFTFTIPVEDLGKRIPVSRYVSTSATEGTWKNFLSPAYFTVLFTMDLYKQLKAAEEKVTDETVKAKLAGVIDRAETTLEVTELQLEKLNGVMMTINAATLYKDNDVYKVDLVINKTSYDKVFLGYASEANKDDTGAIPIINDTENKVSYVTIPVIAFDEPVVYAFHGSKYFNRTFTITKTKLSYDNTNLTLEQFDNMTEEEAIARAEADTSVETVNALIEAIKVQKRDENTDKYCAIARAYYDALSTNDKAKLDDPGYFGDATGDASLDDPLNQDEIGKKELLVVSFGTSFNDSRTTDIGGVEKALQAAYPDWSVRRAFTAQIIINHVQARDGEKIDNMDQALQRAVANGVKRLVIQPTHLMHGAEYDELMESVNAYKDKFVSVSVAEPLLGQVGSDGTVVNTDKETAAKAMVAEAVSVAGFDTLDAMADSNTALVFMGHGTAHNAAVTYSQMQTQFNELGYSNVFVGTVEGNPEETAFPAVKQAVENAGYTKVILRPMMVVAGDHANNDMAADEEGSWYYGFVNGGEFEVEGSDAPVDTGAGFGADNVTCQIEGLGRIDAIQQMYVAHAEEAVREASIISIADAKVTGIKDMTYTGKALTQDLKVTYGDAALVENTDYTVKYANNTNAGKATITLTGINDYKGTLEKTFTINPKKITPKVKLSKTAYTYNGKTNKPTVTVYNGTTKLSSKNYTVSIKGRKNVGRNAVKVTLKGNYKGTKTVYFQINPKKATIKTPAATKSTVTVKWKAQKDKMSAERITGYQVQLATNKAFTKGLKDVKVKGYTKTSKKFKNLKAKKTYYVRVRTYKVISKKYYYSAWSTVKNIKTPAK